LLHNFRRIFLALQKYYDKTVNWKNHYKNILLLFCLSSVLAIKPTILYNLPSYHHHRRFSYDVFCISIHFQFFKNVFTKKQMNYNGLVNKIHLKIRFDTLFFSLLLSIYVIRELKSYSHLHTASELDSIHALPRPSTPSRFVIKRLINAWRNRYQRAVKKKYFVIIYDIFCVFFFVFSFLTVEKR